MNSDMPRQREVLAELVKSAKPVKLGFAKYAASIGWTPLGDGLQKVLEELQQQAAA